MRLHRCALGLLTVAGVLPLCGPAGDSLALARAQSPQILLKHDFDSGANPFASSGSAAVTLVDASSGALAGRSLHIRRTGPGGYFGAIAPLQISGSAGLRIAFVVRARAMHAVAVNVYDEKRQDNTTPASPARIDDEAWRPVVFAVEDFHYNSAQPDAKIPAETAFASLLFHGRETGPSPEITIDKLAIYRGRDDAPPAAPSAVRAVTEADGAIAIGWQEPADDTFAVVYSIHRRRGAGAWEKIGESLQPAYRDRPSSPETHAYRVTAADYENNVSPPSAEVTATPPAVAAPVRDAAAAPSVWIADRRIYADHIRQVHARGAGRVRRDVFLFAGDSITAAARYTHILGSWLARGRPVRQGVGTITTEYGAANIRKYLTDAAPEFAIVMYGTNDVGRGDSISGAMRNLSTIVDACLEAGTIPVLATIPPRGFDKGNQRNQERYNRAVAELGRQKRVPVSYAFEEMMQHDLKNVLFDGIHLRPENGNDIAGRALRRTMDQVYFALRLP